MQKRKGNKKPAQKVQKKKRMNVPNEVNLLVKIPKRIKSYPSLQKYMWQNFHIDIDIEPESDTYEQLFYNSDLRSFMGIMHDFNPASQNVEGELSLTVFPRYYVDIDDPNGYWSKLWFKLLNQSRIVPRGVI